MREEDYFFPDFLHKRSVFSGDAGFFGVSAAHKAVEVRVVFSFSGKEHSLARFNEALLLSFITDG